MSRRVLILSSRQDPHAAAVADHLDQLSVSFDFFKYEQLIADYDFDLSLGANADRGALVNKKTQERLDLSGFSSVWHRRPGFFRAPEFSEAWITRLVEAEMRTAMSALLNSIRGLWVNRIDADSRCLQKLEQLRVAESLGLRVPRTLVTNRQESVKDLFDSCDGKLVYKLLSEGSQRYIPSFETPPGIATMPVRERDFPFLDQVVCAPHLFQEHIAKQFDVRVTVIGKSVFATKIDSQSGAGNVDWRNDYSVKMEAMNLPASVEKLCLDLTRTFGLNDGAIDLCVTPQDEFVFFEINCAGQFLWAEHRTEQPMARELAKLLAQEVEPLCP